MRLLVAGGCIAIGLIACLVIPTLLFFKIIAVYLYIGVLLVIWMCIALVQISLISLSEARGGAFIKLTLIHFWTDKRFLSTTWAAFFCWSFAPWH
jgi:hypothetical protein